MLCNVTTRCARPSSCFFRRAETASDRATERTKGKTCRADAAREESAALHAGPLTGPRAESAVAAAAPWARRVRSGRSSRTRYGRRSSSPISSPRYVRPRALATSRERGRSSRPAVMLPRLSSRLRAPRLMISPRFDGHALPVGTPYPPLLTRRSPAPPLSLPPPPPTRACHSCSTGRCS